jgi:hypothetical protein
VFTRQLTLMGNDLLASFDSALCPYETTLNEGHGFSRAVNGGVDEGFSPEVCLSNRLWRTLPRKEMPSPYMSRKAYLSGLKPWSAQAVYGTAEAVPFVRRIEEANLDKSDVLAPAHRA